MKKWVLLNPGAGVEGVEVAALQGDEEKEEDQAINLDPFCRGEDGDARR